jgi:hypothetical protein
VGKRNTTWMTSHYIELKAQQNIEAGMSPEEARCAAL